MNNTIEIVREVEKVDTLTDIDSVSDSILKRFKNRQIRKIMLVTPPDADVSFFDLDYAKERDMLTILLMEPYYLLED